MVEFGLGDKKRMRHPLRNEWDKHKVAFARLARSHEASAAMARLMIELVPPFIDWLEAERDNGTRGVHLLGAIASAAGCLIENGVEHRMVNVDPRSALRQVLVMIEQTVLPRVVGGRKQPRIILPGMS